MDLELLPDINPTPNDTSDTPGVQVSMYAYHFVSRTNYV